MANPERVQNETVCAAAKRFVHSTVPRGDANKNWDDVSML